MTLARGCTSEDNEAEAIEVQRSIFADATGAARDKDRSIRWHTMSDKAEHKGQIRYTAETRLLWLAFCS